MRSRDGFPHRSSTRRPFDRGCCVALFTRSPANRGLGSRPCTLLQSGERMSARFSEPDAAYRLLQLRQQHASTPLERPILARSERTALLGLCVLCVCPRFPSPAFEGLGIRQLTSFEMSGQRATSSLNDARLLATTSSPNGGTPQVTALREAACGRFHDPATGCADDRLER